MTHERDAVLRDGTSILIRGVRASDREGVRGLFARMSPESVRHRFFAAKRELLASDLVWIDRLGTDEVALAGVLRRGGHEELLGIARTRGISTFRAYVEADNARMLEVF